MNNTTFFFCLSVLEFAVCSADCKGVFQVHEGKKFFSRWLDFALDTSYFRLCGLKKKKKKFLFYLCNYADYYLFFMAIVRVFLVFLIVLTDGISCNLMKDKLRFKFKIGEFWGFINMNRRNAILYSTREMKSWKVCSSEVNYEISGDVGTSSFYDLNFENSCPRVPISFYYLFFFFTFPPFVNFFTPGSFSTGKN